MWQPGKNTWASAGSADRTKQPISDLLAQFLPRRDSSLLNSLPAASDEIPTTRSQTATDGQTRTQKQTATDGQPSTPVQRSEYGQSSTGERSFRVLEVASGFGSHVSVFAHDYPHIHFQPSEAQPECLESLVRLSQEHDNIEPPVLLNVLDQNHWDRIEQTTYETTQLKSSELKSSEPTKDPRQLDRLGQEDEAVSSDRAGEEGYDVVICINMIHISPWACTSSLFHRSSRLLRDGGLILLYGAYLADDGSFSSASDAEFDATLKSRDASFGLRSPKVVDDVAKQYGFERVFETTMALNNRVFVWRLHKTT